MARILIIDDDDHVRLSLKLALEDEDHDVAEAADGEEGMRRLRERPAHLVITDIFMPEKEGLETIDAIRRDYPDTRIIAISGGGRMDPREYLEIACRVGADRSLMKPFDLRQLVALVDELLDGGEGG